VAGEPIEALAQKHGTPFYIYDACAVRERVAELRKAFASARLLYAVKANPCAALLRALHGAVDGPDVASSGEIALGRDAGFAPGAMSFAGPGKTEREIGLAVDLGISLSAESPRE